MKSVSPRSQANQANIPVDNRGTTRVADFGLVTMVGLSTIFLSETDSSGGRFCWMSPELLDPLRFGSNGRSTRESDGCALGMVIYEVSWLHLRQWSLTHPSQVLTGLRPFYRLGAYLPVSAVLRGERPEKPLETESLGLSYVLWELVQSRWSESSSARPTARQLLDSLTPASPLQCTPPSTLPIQIHAGLRAYRAVPLLIYSSKPLLLLLSVHPYTVLY